MPSMTIRMPVLPKIADPTAISPGITAQAEVTRQTIIDLYCLLYTQFARTYDPDEVLKIPAIDPRARDSVPVLRRLLPHQGRMWYAPDWRAPRHYIVPAMDMDARPPRGRRPHITTELILSGITICREGGGDGEGEGGEACAEEYVTTFDVLERMLDRQAQFRSLHHSLPLLEHSIEIAEVKLASATATLGEKAEAANRELTAAGGRQRGYGYGEGPWNTLSLIPYGPAAAAYESQARYVSLLRPRLIWLRLWLAVERDQVSKLKGTQKMNVKVGQRKRLVSTDSIIEASDAISALIAQRGDDYFDCLRRQSLHLRRPEPPHFKGVSMHDVVLGAWYAQTLRDIGMTWQEMCEERRPRPPGIASSPRNAAGNKGEAARRKARGDRQWAHIAAKKLKDAIGSRTPEGFEDRKKEK